TIDELTEGQLRYELIVGDSEGAGNLLQRALPEGSRQLALPEGESRLAKRIGFKGLLPTGESIEVARNTLTIGSDDPKLIQPIIDRVRAEGGVITSVRNVRPSLEDLFMQAVTDPTTGETLKPGAEEGGGR